MRSRVWFTLLLAVAAARVQAQAGEGGATATGVSRALNPAISVNGLFLAAGFAELPAALKGDEAYESGLRLQEAEFQFSAAIDPYAKADLILTVEGGNVDFEEAVVTSDVLSHGIGLRAGRFLVPIGHENRLHAHQLPFVQRSLVGSAVFGEGLGEFGLQMAYVPLLPWFLEVHAAVLNGDDERLFEAPGDWDLAYSTGAETLWEVSEGGTISVGADYLAGPNSFGNENETTWTQVAAGVLRYKWRSPSRPRERAAEILAEYEYATRDAAFPAPKLLDRGAYALAKAQVARRLWVQGRYDYHVPSAGDIDAQRGSVLLAFVPSEFSALRLQGSVVDQAGETFGELLLQFNFTIGSHPAHKY